MPTVDEVMDTLKRLEPGYRPGIPFYNTFFSAALTRNDWVYRKQKYDVATDKDKQEMFYGQFFQQTQMGADKFPGCAESWTSSGQPCPWRDCIALMTDLRDVYFGTLQGITTANHLLGIFLRHKPLLLLPYIFEVASALSSHQTLDHVHLMGMPLLFLGEYEKVTNEQ